MNITFQQIKDHRKIINPPEHILGAAKCIWKPINKAEDFLRTSCELTTYAIKDLITPGQAYDEHIWKYSETLPEPKPLFFEVIFGEPGGEEHFMFVIDDKLYQSYAFIHEVIETKYDPSIPLWRQVSHKHDKYINETVYFNILSK